MTEGALAWIRAILGMRGRFAAAAQGVGRRSIATTLTLLVALSFAGCARPKDMPDLGTVTGKVTIDGQPLGGVIISFMPDKGRSAASTTDAEGHYELVYLNNIKGCKVGPNTIGFFAPTGGSPSHPIPAKYQNKSDFKVDVKPTANTFDFDLKSDSAPPKPPRKTGPVLD